ncbi:hypothetical protein H0H87_012457 [Tephrocybe sp. NHM501043]|nr:hypothetical protein H0H87_012457 [Tephrocybe sp. NHM501043]
MKASRQAYPEVPYKLLPTPQLASLVPGRRKAIEWSRAIAIQNAYTQEIRDVRFRSQDLIPLTTADVYHWLSEEGHFIRPPAAIRPKIEAIDTMGKAKQLDDVVPRISPAVKPETEAAANSVKLEHGDDHAGIKTTSPCNARPKNITMPMVNVLSRIPTDVLAVQRCMTDTRTKDYQDGELVAAADPNLTSAIYDCVNKLQLPTFASSQGHENLYPVDKLGPDSTQVERYLAPHATLAIVVRQFVRTLIEGGVEVLKCQKETSSGEQTRDPDMTEESIPDSVLTPSHILERVVTRREAAKGDSLDIAMFECLSRLGVPATFAGPWLLNQDPMGFH